MIDEPAPEFASTTAVVLGSAVPRKVGLKKYREKWLLLFFCSLPASDEDCDVEAVVTRRVELERKYGCRVLGVASGFTVEDITMWVRRRNNGKNSNGKLQHFRSLGAADVCIISDPDYAIARRYGIPLVASPAVSSGGSGGGGDGVGERTAGAREVAQAMFLLSPDGLVKYRSLIGTAERNIEEHMMLLQTYFFTDLGPASASSTSVHHHQQQQQLSDGVPQRTMGDVRNYVYSMRSSANSEAEDVDPPGGSGATAELDGDLKVGAALLSAGSWYQRQLRVRPLVTKAVTSCAVGLLGEIIGASINRYYAVRRSGGISGEGAAGFCKNVLNWRRLAIFGVYGLLVTGPFFHWWYGFLERLVKDCKITSSYASFLMKLGLNQLVLTPPFLLFTLSYLNYCMTLSTSSTVQAVKRTYAAALFTNWKVWTVAQAVNFQLVPLDYRVLFGNLVALWWNIYLSVVSNTAA